jgi:hypothetical protein
MAMHVHFAWLHSVTTLDYKCMCIIYGLVTITAAYHGVWPHLGLLYIHVCYVYYVV